MDAPDIQTILPQFLEFCAGAVMVAHNADFDMSFIIENCKRQGLPQEYTYVDTVGMARFLLPALNRFKLDTVAKAVGVSLTIITEQWTMQHVRLRFLYDLWKC